MIDRWIHGQGITSEKEFMVRIVEPRCLVRVATSEELDSDPDDWPNTNAPSVINEAGEEFVVVAWFDEAPDEAIIKQILDEAVVANEHYTEEAELPTCKCRLCGYEWHPRTPGRPRKCPSCHSLSWDRPLLECRRCGHTWHSRTPGRPRSCPGCRSAKWDG